MGAEVCALKSRGLGGHSVAKAHGLVALGFGPKRMFEVPTDLPAIPRVVERTRDQCVAEAAHAAGEIPLDK